MKSQKGLTLTLQLVITAIVLVLTALTVLIATQARIIESPDRIEDQGDRFLCINERDLYCKSNFEGCWDSKLSKQGSAACKDLLERTNTTSLYNCQTSDWYSEEDYAKIRNGELKVTCSSLQQ